MTILAFPALIPYNKIHSPYFIFIFLPGKYDACTVQCMFKLDHVTTLHANKQTDGLHVPINHKLQFGKSHSTPVGGAGAFSKNQR